MICGHAVYIWPPRVRTNYRVRARGYLAGLFFYEEHELEHSDGINTGDVAYSAALTGWIVNHAL